MATGSYCAAADTGSHEFTLNLAAGALQFDDADQLRDDMVLDLRLGYDILGRNPAQSLGIEAGASYINSSSGSDGKTAKGYLLRVDATYPISPPKNRTIPFLALGIGARLLDRGDSSSSSALLAYGAGLKYFITDSVAFRIDWRHNLIYENVGTLNNFQYQAGLSYILHSDNPVRRIPVPRPIPKEKKKQPVSPLPSPVQPEKAPEPVPEPAAPVTNQPAPQLPPPKVAAPAQALATQSLAPRAVAAQSVTAAPSSVKPAAPAAADSEEVSNVVVVVLFDTSSSQIKPQYLGEIRKMASYLKTHPGASVVIEGHADRTGSARKNQPLSERRAHSIGKALAALLAPQKVDIEIRSFGSQVPVQDNESTSGRMYNRRGTIMLRKP